MIHIPETLQGKGTSLTYFYYFRWRVLFLES